MATLPTSNELHNFQTGTIGTEIKRITERGWQGRRVPRGIKRRRGANHLLPHVVKDKTCTHMI